MNRRILLNCEWTLKRVLSTNASKFDGTTNVSEITKDYIGPPHIKSNIRPIIRHIPENETKTECLLRTRATEIEKWNHEIWESHNKRFFDERDAFIAANKPKDSDTVPADKMSEFYKYFLDKNWSLHFYYNVSWYMKNVELLLLSAQTYFTIRHRNLSNYVAQFLKHSQEDRMATITTQLHSLNCDPKALKVNPIVLIEF